MSDGGMRECQVAFVRIRCRVSTERDTGLRNFFGCSNRRVADFNQPCPFDMRTPAWDLRAWCRLRDRVEYEPGVHRTEAEACCGVRRGVESPKVDLFFERIAVGRW